MNTPLVGADAGARSSSSGASWELVSRLQDATRRSLRSLLGGGEDEGRSSGGSGSGGDGHYSLLEDAHTDLHIAVVAEGQPGRAAEWERKKERWGQTLTNGPCLYVEVCTLTRIIL
jgi:hypothetical protein